MRSEVGNGTTGGAAPRRERLSGIAANVAELVSVYLLPSVGRFASLAVACLVPRRSGAGKLSPARALTLLWFLPLFALVQTLQWIGLLLDEILYPRYRRVAVDAPVFIAGLPRSGTTLLHRTLALDDRFTTFSTWELILGVSITSRRLAALLARLDRLAGRPLARTTALAMRPFSDRLADVHPLALDAPEEDFLALCPVLGCFLLVFPFPFAESLWRLSSFDTAMPASERRRLMRFYRLCAQKHLYVHGPDRRFLSKNASFASLADALRETFPDCRLVACVRDPIEAAPSLVNAVQAGLRAFVAADDHREVEARLVETLRHGCAHLLPRLGEGDATVPLDALAGDLAGTVTALYARLDIPLPPRLRARLEEAAGLARAHVRRTPVGGGGAGLAVSRIRSDFTDYYRWQRRGGSAPAGRAAAAKEPAPCLREAESAAGIRVAVVSDALRGRNGVDAYYRDLVAHLCGRVAEVALIGPEPNGDEDLTLVSIPLPGDRTQTMHVPRAGALWARLRALAPDVVLIATPGPFGLAGAVFARRLEARLIAGFHTHFERLAELYWNRALGAMGRECCELAHRLLFRRADVVVVNGEDMAPAARRLGAARVCVVGTPVSPCFLSPPAASPRMPPRSVLYAGRLAPEKNVEAVLAAAALLPDLHFVVAGAGPLAEEARTRAGALGNLDYVGRVSRERLVGLLDGADVTLLPSRVEAFGTAALEAMARGRLVLVSRECGIARWPGLADGLLTIGAGESVDHAIRRVAAAPPASLAATARAGMRAARSVSEAALEQWMQILGERGPGARAC